jgi:transposase
VHGVKQITVSWAEPGSQFTAWFERLAMDLLRECSVTGAAGLLRLTWDEARGIKARAVARGLQRRTQEVVPPLGVDEKAMAKGHRSLTVVADLTQSRVLYLAEDRKQESWDGFWATLTPKQLAGIEAIAMDLWEPYVQSTRAHVAEAEDKIVFDKFPVAKPLHDAVDRVRRTEHRGLSRVIQISPVRVIENSPSGFGGRRRFLHSDQPRFQFLLEPIGMASDIDGDRMMEPPIQDRGRQPPVPEDLPPGTTTLGTGQNHPGFRS